MRFALSLFLVGCQHAGTPVPDVIALPSAVPLPAVTPSMDTFHLTTPCVPLQDTTFLIHRDVTQSSPPDPQYPTRTSSVVSVSGSRHLDLDGDGVLEWVVPEPQPADCLATMHWAIYLVRGSCGHRLGVVEGEITPELGAQRNGLPELITRTEVQRQPDPRVPATLVSTTRVYRFDAGAYGEVSAKSGESVCHHCPSQRCTVSPRD